MNEQPDFENHSLLKPAQSSPDSVRMEIIWARFPVNDPGLNEEAWQDIDEAQLDPATQRELANNGLRAGVIKGKLPDADKANITESKALKLMLAQPSIIKRPVLELSGGKLLVGFKPEQYEAALG